MTTNIPKVDVERIDISPNPAPLFEELNLEVDFHLDQQIIDGIWDIQYLVDSVLNRHIIKLGQIPAKTYKKGANHFQFTVPEIPINGIPASQLTNCGLLIATFKTQDMEILDLKMIIQVSEQSGVLHRVIYNPLE